MTLRPGEDGISWLTAHLPAEQGAACLAALDRAHRDLSAAPAPLTHGRGQVMADAPVRHLDHIHRAADGGRTELDNGRGLCAFHNHLREQPGWHVRRTPHGVATTTPTGHTYLAPPG